MLEVDVYRTPDERFDGLPGLRESRYHDWDGVRLAYVDEGDGAPVLMLHGQPTWSYMFRRAMDPLLEAGYRCVAPDLPGFGRSDKPLDVAWYSYDRHVAAVAALVEALDLHDITLFMHDWGGPIGLRIATAGLGDRITRLVAMDTPILSGEREPGDSWRFFRDLVAQREDLPIGRIVRLGCRNRPKREVTAAYDAPFPDAASKAGVLAFPQLVPLTRDDPAARAGREIAGALRDDHRPALLMWADSDPIFPREDYGRDLTATVPNGGDLVVLDDCGHFVPEDQGERVGTIVAEWLDEADPRGVAVQAEA
jgi:haloalkane dehalogenase